MREPLPGLDEMNKCAKQRLGAFGERIAREHLLKSGHVVLALNYRTPFGEIDIVSRHGNVTCFVEVKTRRSRGYGYPEEKVNAKKIETMKKSALYFIQGELCHDRCDKDYRLDVIAVLLNRFPDEYGVTHFENITA